MTRSEITAILKDATISHFSHKKYSCFNEIAVNRWGKLRADILALSFRGNIIMAEIKSARADYVADLKWRSYLDYCDRFFFVMTQSVYERLKTRLRVDLKGTGVGVLILDPNTGYLRSVMSSRLQTLSDDTRWTLLIRMAWRSGISCRTVRRKRYRGIT